MGKYLPSMCKALGSVFQQYSEVQNKNKSRVIYCDGDPGTLVYKVIF